MKAFHRLLICILCILLTATLHAQDFSNKGKEFWIAYSYHVGMAQGGLPVMTLYITSDVNTAYSVERYGVGGIQSGTITAGQVVTVTIPTTCILDNEGKFTGRTIRVQTEKNSVVYAYITRSAVSGATVCLPTPVLGKEYYSTNYTQLSNEPNSNSFFTIIAAEDNTTVEIIPAASTKNGWVAGNTYSVSLNKGEIYQVLGTTNGNSGSDLTGSIIRSVSSGSGGCRRIAVFSGSGKIGIGCGSSAGTSDNLYQQLYPTGSWGMNYLTVPSFDRATNYFRIIKKNATTAVYVNGVLVPSSSFINGTYYEFSNTIPNQITANEPISVAQYFTTQGCAGNGTPYDPDMIMLNPVEQNINNVTLVSSNLVAPQNQQHHLHVIMRNSGSGISSFKLDGSPIATSSWTVHPSDPNYSYLYLPDVTQGYHTLKSDSGFNALAYGYANAETYGYSAGANVKDQYQFVSILNQYATVNFPATCRNTPFYFRIVFPYQPTQIQWVFGGALNAMGIADVIQASPVYDSSWLVNGRMVYRYSITTPYTITAIGTYPIKIVANNPTPDGCSGVQEIDYDLQVFDPPVAGFSFLTNGCVNAAVSFSDTSNTSGRPVIKWSWDFDDATSSAINNPSHTFASAGTYDVSLSVITDVGCLSDTAHHTITLTNPPLAKFGAAGPYCVGRSINFTDSSMVTGGATIVKWYWDFGDGSPVIIANTNSPQSHVYTTAGNFTATLKVETTTGCQSELFSKLISIKVNPVASFNLNGNICLPGGTASFTNTTSISDGSGSSITYQWQFGDGNNSNSINPIHNYTAIGPFTVSLVATSNNGCVDDTSKLISNIYTQPQAAFIAPSEICFGDPVSFSDQSVAAGSTVTQWSWNFGDATTSNLQNPVKNYSTPGTYSVTLTITSAAGCISTIATRSITVNPLPVANFGISAPACEGRDITFSDASVANAGNLVKWSWNYGDGNNNDFSSPAPFIYNYPTAGNYIVTLQVETNKGCKSAINSKPLTIHVRPDAGFISPEICLTDPFAPFVDSSKVSTGSIVSWQWNFGDVNAGPGNPNSSSQQNPTHQYGITGNYTASLIIVSNQGCRDTITQSFTVNGSIPVANFTVQNPNVLCSNREVIISNTSTVDFGIIVKTEIYWDWLNDPTNVDVDNTPTPGKTYNHLYPEFGSPSTRTFTIRMVSYSCISCLNIVTKTITLLATPQVIFSNLPPVCSNHLSFQLIQGGLSNTLPGSGQYTGPGVTGTVFNPSTAGAGLHTIRYTYTGSNGCDNYAEQTILVHPTPQANAGPDKIVLEGTGVQLTPAIFNSYPVTYTWAPSTSLSNPSIANPIASPTNDITYTLTLTSQFGCNSGDEVYVKVLKIPEIPNVFTPNKDGINDTWVIRYLERYAGCVVEIYNRYGQLVFRSIGYNKPWDGTYNGKEAPAGTYYYIVDPKNGRSRMAGFVDIVR